MAGTLSIVVCTYNQADSLAETLRCLGTQQGTAASDFEVVVVNNRCTDHTSAVVAAAAAGGVVREVTESVPGQVHARVRGVRESRGEWVAFVDDDNFLDPDWVAVALRFIAVHPRCGAFGGRVDLLWGAPPPPAVARRAYAYAATDLPGGERLLAGEERWRLRGAGLVCRRQALQDAGWLDWRVNVGRAGTGTLAGDDTEIVMRVARAGWELWVAPGCHLRHAIGPRRLTVPYLRALHRGFAQADPVLLGFQRRSGTLVGWAGRLVLLLARRLYWLVRHAGRGLRDADARLTALLTFDTLRGNLAGLSAVVRLSPRQRKAWLGQTPPVNEDPAPSSTLRVLHLHSGRDYGGLERMIFCLALDRAAGAGMEPVFGLGHHERLAREIEAVGARVEILGGTSLRHPWRVLGAIRRLRALVRRERFGAVICHGSAALALLGAGVRGLGVPVVLWMHSDTKIANKNLVEWLAGRVRPALVVCNSAFTAASLPLLFAEPPPHVIIPCPVPRPTSSPDRDRERRTALRAELTTPPDAVVIILPSRLEEWKGHRVLLDALVRLRDLPGWCCWIVGGPFDATQKRFQRGLIDQAEAGGIAAQTRFTGQRADVPDLLAAADVFCQPNLTPEPFGVNVIEALYAGLPVVGSDSGGTREIVDETCGCLVAPGDAPALAAALDRLIRDAGYRDALGARAAARGEAVASPRRIIPILHEHLNRLAPLRVSRRAGARPPAGAAPEGVVS